MNFHLVTPSAAVLFDLFNVWRFLGGARRASRLSVISVRTEAGWLVRVNRAKLELLLERTAQLCGADKLTLSTARTGR